MTGALTYGAAATDLLLCCKARNHRRQSDRRPPIRFAFARSRRWSYTSERRDHRLERIQRLAAFPLRRNFGLFRAQR